MLLAEALTTHKVNEDKITSLIERAHDNAKWQEGDAPAEDAMQLTQEAADLMIAQAVLEFRIMRTNQQAEGPQGETLAAMISRRKALRRQAGLYREQARHTTLKQDRWSRNEIKLVTTIPVQDLQARADTLAREARELDTEIQKLNFTVELAVI